MNLLKPFLEEKAVFFVNRVELKKWINHYKISQADLADEIGCSRSHMSDVLRGYRLFGQDKINKLSDAITGLISLKRRDQTISKND